MFAFAQTAAGVPRSRCSCGCCDRNTAAATATAAGKISDVGGRACKLWLRESMLLGRRSASRNSASRATETVPSVATAQSALSEMQFRWSSGQQEVQILVGVQRRKIRVFLYVTSHHLVPWICFPKWLWFPNPWIHFCK